MPEYRAVLCGLGNIAWRFDQVGGLGRAACLSHAGAYQLQQKTTLVGGFSPASDDRHAFSQAFGLPVYDNLSEMLSHARPDIVSICSPSQVHFEQVMTCLESAIPMIWLEKPPALSSAEMETLLARAAATKSTVLVNYQRRYLPIYQELRRRFLSRSLGCCRQIQVNYSKGLETNGSHILDMLFFLVGNHVETQLQWLRKDGEFDNPSFGLTCGDITVEVSGMALPYHNIDIAVTCDEGRYCVLHGGMTGMVEKKNEHELFPGFYRLAFLEDATFSGLAGLTGGMENALNDLLDAYENHRDPFSGLFSARKTMTLIEQVREWQVGNFAQ